MKLNKKKKGFTLIELMAVIAIVAILAAVLVPTVSGYIERSKKTALITQVRNVVNAVEVYNSTASTSLNNGLTVAELSTGTPTSGADANLTSFYNQQLLSDKDVDKLATALTYANLKIMNEDPNVMNNISKVKSDKSKSDKFVYTKDSTTKDIVIEK